MLTLPQIKRMIARLMEWDATLTREEARAIVAEHGGRAAITEGTVSAAGRSIPAAVLLGLPANT